MDWNQAETAAVPMHPAMAGQMGLQAKMMNPTMRENIEAKIQYHKDEIVRLEAIKEKLPQLLDVNLRDLREAMQF